MPELLEHIVSSMVLQRVVGIALGYDDLNDHNELRHDPVLAVLAGKLTAKRAGCAPLAGKSTLNRPELSRPEPTSYHKVNHDPVPIERLFVDMCLDARRRPPGQIILDLDVTDDPLHGHQDGHQVGRFFHGYYDCYLPLYIFCGRHLLAAKLGGPTSTPRPERSRRCRRLWHRSVAAGRGRGSCCAMIPALPAKH
jgi:hypothetical protein